VSRSQELVRELTYEMVPFLANRVFSDQLLVVVRIPGLIVVDVDRRT